MKRMLARGRVLSRADVESRGKSAEGGQRDADTGWKLAGARGAHTGAPAGEATLMALRHFTLFCKQRGAVLGRLPGSRQYCPTAVLAGRRGDRARGDGAGFLPPAPPDAPAQALPSAASLGSWPLHLPASVRTSLQRSLELLAQTPLSCSSHLLEFPRSFTCSAQEVFILPLKSVSKCLPTVGEICRERGGR